MSGSTKRPERGGPDSTQGAAGGSGRGGEPQAARSTRALILDELPGPIDLRARARSSAGEAAASSGTWDAAPSPSRTGPIRLGTSWAQLVDSLTADVLLSHVPGRRVLDLGYGSPEIAGWIKERVGDHLSIVEKGALEQAPGKIVDHSGFLPASEFLDSEGNLKIPDEDEDDDPILSLPEYRDGAFEVVYSLRTFPHLGYDTESSERLGRQLLREAARVSADGGTVFIQIANSRSLRGIVEGIRNPITVVSRRRMILGDRFGLTRWDTLPRFLRYLPPELEFVGVHGLGVLIPHNATLRIPIIGSILERLEWRLRDMPGICRFGAQLLVVLRRTRRDDPSLLHEDSLTSSLSNSLREAISSGTRGVSSSAGAPGSKRS